MSRWQKRLFAFLGGLAMLSLVIWFTLPRAINLLPGGIQARLPEPILEAIQTPLPEALPTPLGHSGQAQGTIAIPTIEQKITTQISPQPSRVLATSEPVLTDSPFKDEYADVSPVVMTPDYLPEPTEMPTRLPGLIRLAGLEVIPQKFNNCGPANLTIALNYYGQDADQLTVGDILKPNYDDRNVSPHELVDYVNNMTPLEAKVFFGGDLTILKRLLSAGFPVIVEKGLHQSEHQGWMGHYLTLYGYDEPAKAFLGLDTYLGPWDGTERYFPYDELTDQWRHFNYTFVVVYESERAELLQELLPSEIQHPLLMWQQAALKASEEVEQAPDDAFAWFNLGASLTHLAELTGEKNSYIAAAAAFDQARILGLPWRMLWYQFEPYQAYLGAGRFQEVINLTGAQLTGAGAQNVEETFIYQGHALLATGDLKGAAYAYRQALKLNPNSSLAQEAIAQLEET